MREDAENYKKAYLECHPDKLAGGLSWAQDLGTIFFQELRSIKHRTPAQSLPPEPAGVSGLDKEFKDLFKTTFETLLNRQRQQNAENPELDQLQNIFEKWKQKQKQKLS